MSKKLALAFLGAALGGMACLGWYGSNRLIRRKPPDEKRSPVEYALDFEEVAFMTGDGLTLRGWWIPAESSRGTVIFCHGHQGSMDPDVQYAPWFHAAGFNVLMFNFRGHGHSEGRYLSLGYFERRDLLAAIDYLQRRGIQSVGVLGFSLGAVVAMITAPLTPAIRAVVADCGFAEKWRAAAGGIGENYPWLGPLTGGLGRWIVLVASARLRVPLWEADPLRWVGRISPRPLLLIGGGHDPYAPPGDMERLYAAAGEPKELWIAPLAGHRNVDTFYPEEYRRRVIGFFERWL